MKELERMQKMLKDVYERDDDEAYGIACFLVSKDKLFNYSRIIDADILRTAPPKTLQFFGDDMMYAFQIAAKAEGVLE